LARKKKSRSGRGVSNNALTLGAPVASDVHAVEVELDKAASLIAREALSQNGATPEFHA
jgi:hypothetical protein